MSDEPQDDTQEQPQTAEAPAVVDVASAAVNPIDAIADAWAALLAQYPKGSRADLIDGYWHFFRGAGSTAHGCGKTLSRAIASVNSTRRRNSETGRMEEISEYDVVLPPE